MNPSVQDVLYAGSKLVEIRTLQSYFVSLQPKQLHVEDQHITSFDLCLAFVPITKSGYGLIWIVYKNVSKLNHPITTTQRWQTMQLGTPVPPSPYPNSDGMYICHLSPENGLDVDHCTNVSGRFPAIPPNLRGFKPSGFLQKILTLRTQIRGK